MKIVFSILLAIAAWAPVYAQELNCTVNVLLPQQVNSPPSLFETMEKTIEDFMNTRKWTKDNYTTEERIGNN